MKIIQIVMTDVTGDLVGLDEDGLIYKWNPNIKDWEPMNQ